MEIRRLPVTDEALRRFVAELWLPYHRELATEVDAHALANRPDGELIAENVEFYRERFETEGARAWVVVESDRVDPATAPCTHPAVELHGHVLTSVDACPSVFDRPDRLVVGDLFVTEPHRGSGLADRLIARATADARDQGCGELRLDVAVDNDRARAFYETQGFEPYREQLIRPVSGT